jgi:hypothetical protein
VAGIHCLPGLQVDGDLALSLLRTRSVFHRYVQRHLADLAYTALGSFEVALEIAEKVSIGDSYSHGRRNPWDGYRHTRLLPIDTNELTRLPLVAITVTVSRLGHSL